MVKKSSTRGSGSLAGVFATCMLILSVSANMYDVVEDLKVAPAECGGIKSVHHVFECLTHQGHPAFRGKFNCGNFEQALGAPAGHSWALVLQYWCAKPYPCYCKSYLPIN